MFGCYGGNTAVEVICSSCPTTGWKQTKAWHGSFQLEENRKSVFFIAVIFDSTRLNQEQDKNLLQRLIWALFLEFIQSLNTKSGTNLTLISLAPARTRKPRLRISSTHSEQRNLLSIWFDAFIHNSKSIFNFSPLSWSSKGGCKHWEQKDRLHYWCKFAEIFL